MGHVHDDSPERLAHELGTVGNFIFLRKNIKFKGFFKSGHTPPLACPEMQKNTETLIRSQFGAVGGKGGGGGGCATHLPHASLTWTPNQLTQRVAALREPRQGPPPAILKRNWAWTWVEWGKGRQARRSSGRRAL